MKIKKFISLSLTVLFVCTAFLSTVSAEHVHVLVDATTVEYMYLSNTQHLVNESFVQICECGFQGTRITENTYRESHTYAHDYEPEFTGNHHHSGVNHYFEMEAFCSSCKSSYTFFERFSCPGNSNGGICIMPYKIYEEEVA